MKKTRSELKRELKTEHNTSEDETLKKKRKKLTNESGNLNVKDDNSESFYKELCERIKKMLEKFDNKPEVCEKKFYASSDKFVKIKKISRFKIVTQMELYYKHRYEEHHKISLTEDICSICQYTFYENLKKNTLEKMLEEDITEKNHVILLDNCSDHYFHLECLEMMIGDKEFTKCPNCNKIYGIMTGDQPPGTMKVKILKKQKCDGFNCETIEMSYEFKNGKNYTGTYRVGYLPHNKEGIELLGLFKVGFDRKLLFTIGTSVTTGATNTTIWNGIHFKTNTHGGPSQFGYPDPTYFNRVKQEFAAKGIIQDNIDENLEDIGNSLLNKSEKKKK
jgi:hypothetical protein